MATQLEGSSVDEEKIKGDTADGSLADFNNQSTPPENIVLQTGSTEAGKGSLDEQTEEYIQSNKDDDVDQTNSSKQDYTTSDTDKHDTEKQDTTVAGEESGKHEQSAQEISVTNEGNEVTQVTETTDQVETDGMEGNIDQEADDNQGVGYSEDHTTSDNKEDQSSIHSHDSGEHTSPLDEHGEEPVTESGEANHSYSDQDNIDTEVRKSQSPVALLEDSQPTQRSEDEVGADTNDVAGSDRNLSQRSEEGDEGPLMVDTKAQEDGGDLTPRSQRDTADYTDTESEGGGDFTLSSQQEGKDSSREPKAEEDVYLETYRPDSSRQTQEADNEQENWGEEPTTAAQSEMDNENEKEVPEDAVTVEGAPAETKEEYEEFAQSEKDDEEQTENVPKGQEATEVATDEGHDQLNTEEEKQNEVKPDPLGPTKEELKEQEEFSKKLDSTEDTSVSVTERLEVISEMLDAEREHLLETPLKDYSRLERLTSVIHSSKLVCKDYENTMLQMSEKINQVNQVINAINKTVERKITNEGVLSWAEQLRTDPSDPESVAREKEVLAKAAAAREALGKASCDIPRAEERAAELTAQTVEAALIATQAQQAAEEARVAAEIAKKAAEKRRLEQEEAKRKAEEAKRQQEEMERLRREDEERKRVEQELLTGGSEEERERIRKEMERRNPKNWPVWVYSVDPGNTGIPVGCVIRCLPDVTLRGMFSVEKVDQLSGILPLEPNEELVSNIIKVTHEDANFKTMEPLCIAIPHCAPRNTSRECVVKMMQPNGRWVEVGTSDAWFDDMREFKFSECRLQKVATVAVVTRIKKEQHTVHKRGGKVVPSVDTRICFTVRQSMFKVSTTVTVEVFPVDSNLVADLHYRKEQCEGLLASSPMIRFHTPLKKFSKPVMVNVPLPQNPAKQKRPSTASANKSASEGPGKARPISAFMSAYARHEEEEEDQVHLLTKNSEGEWLVVEGVHLVQPKNKDIITFEMDQPLRKFMVMRCKSEVSFSGMERIATMMEETYTERVVQFLLRQKDDDAGHIVVHCDPVSRIEGIVKKLGEAGFNYGPLPSQDIVVHEGQPMKITFRGNVIGEEGQNLNLVYNSHIKTVKEFRVAVKDTFAQKSIDCFRGFCQISLPTSEIKPDDMSTSVFLKKQLKAELLINLPKPEPEAPKAIVERAPVQVKSDGLVDRELLHQIAADLGEEWKRLAQQLNIKRMRIQAIIRNNVEWDTEHVIYEMLITWMKRVPKSANKVDILCNALQAIGRVDTAEVIRDKELDFKKEKALSNRDSYLRKAFVQIAQSPYIVSDWKFLGRQLEVRELDLSEVDDTYTSMREKCFHCLIKWREVHGMDATPGLLVETLRKCKYHHVADQVHELLKNAM